MAGTTSSANVGERPVTLRCRRSSEKHSPITTGQDRVSVSQSTPSLTDEGRWLATITLVGREASRKAFSRPPKPGCPFQARALRLVPAALAGGAVHLPGHPSRSLNRGITRPCRPAVRCASCGRHAPAIPLARWRLTPSPRLGATRPAGTDAP